MTDPIESLRTVAEGTRVVLRYRLHDDVAGATDVIGYVAMRSETQVAVASAKGMVAVDYADVIAAKEVPPPPERRATT